MDNNLNLTVQDILNKEFHVDFKGYAPAEVDGYLDQILEDYQSYDAKIKKLSEEAVIAERTIASLKAKIIELEGKQKAIEESNPTNVSQMDILKRLSRLEQVVYNNIKD